ncbi:MAG: ABC transporter ATP-binding protein [Candidatus Wallbacteria bacterium]|nr:ABC transporter ATP-binding protein [Candidatus Wallbacteria bacterium]
MKHRIFSEYLHFLLSRKGIFSCLILLMVMNLVLDMASPLLIKAVLDKLSAGTSAESYKEAADFILRCCLALFVIYFLGQCVSFGKDYLSLILQTDFIFCLRSKFIGKLFDVSFELNRNKNFSTLVSLFDTDISAVSTLCQQFLFGVLMNSFHLAGLVAFVYFLNYKLAVIGTAVLILYFLIVKLSARKFESTSRLLRRERIKLSSHIFERLVRVLKIKLLSRESVEYSNVDRRFHVFKSKLYRVSGFQMLVEQLKEFSGVIGNLLILLFGSLFVLSGRITIGTLIAFNNYFSKIYQPASVLFNLKLNYHKTLISFKRIDEFLSNPDESVEDAEKQDAGSIEAISIQGLSFEFIDELPLFTDLDLEIRKGEVIGLTGPNGSGKTTLAMILTGFYLGRISGGRILINGEDIKTIKRSALRKRISLILQHPDLFSGTIGSLLESAPAGREIAESRLKKLGFFDLIENKGENFRIEEGGRNLSGGERQRMCLMESIIASETERDIFILDEVESAQDKVNTEKIKDAVAELKKNGKTVIIITHGDTFSQLLDKKLDFRKVQENLSLE